MKNLMGWFLKKKKSIQDCADFEMDEVQSDQFFGGFKEYMPPIYEHESAVKSTVKVSDLFSAQTENK